MIASVVADIEGARSLVIEKTDKFGGTTALSGGVIWIPDNDDMKSQGIDDSVEDALSYLRAVVGDDVPESKLLAYIEHAPDMLRYLAKHTHLRFQAATSYGDYYPELPGAKPGGRSMEILPINRRQLGDDMDNQRFPPWINQGFMRYSNTVKELREVMDMTWRGKFYMARSIIRYHLDFAARRRGDGIDNRMTLGRGLVAGCRQAMQRRDIPLWLNTEALELLKDDGRVVGLRARREGKEINIRAHRGVLFAAGGMGHNTEMRQRYGQLPTGESFSSESPANVGDAQRMGLDIGAALAFMGSAWWTPSVKTPEGDMLALISGKSMPGSVFVDSLGKRFCNEAAPYEDITKAQWAHHRAGIACVPCHMVFDARFRHEYLAGPIPPGKVQPDDKLPEAIQRSGFLTKADSIAELARKIGVDAEGLADTVARNNRYAVTGKDLDFGRGDSAHDRYYSDPSITPNPNIAPIERAPFYAIKIYPGDLGTKGGLKCDEFARVLDSNDQPIEGLYVTGNSAGSVMGDSYPGAGSTIGPAMTFGYIAARHAATQGVDQEESPT